MTRRPCPTRPSLYSPGKPFVPSRERALPIDRKRQVRVELSAELLNADGIVLVPFPP